ncbi:hypothetical protein ABEF93_006901 [Exophiala dermatitidis]
MSAPGSPAPIRTSSTRKKTARPQHFSTSARPATRPPPTTLHAHTGISWVPPFRRRLESPLMSRMIQLFLMQLNGVRSVGKRMRFISSPNSGLRTRAW